MSALGRVGEGLRAQFEGMGERDRRIALGFVSVLTLLLTIALAWGLRSLVADEASRVKVAREGLRDVEEMIVELQGLRARIAAAEGRMKGFQANQMNTYLEGWAKKAGVSAALSVKPGQASAAGNFQAMPYQVSIAKADYGSVVTFLYEIETSAYPIRVRSARIRAEGRPGERTLRADFEVVAYSREEGG